MSDDEQWKRGLMRAWQQGDGASALIPLNRLVEAHGIVAVLDADHEFLSDCVMLVYTKLRDARAADPEVKREVGQRPFGHIVVAMLRGIPREQQDVMLRTHVVEQMHGLELGEGAK